MWSPRSCSVGTSEWSTDEIGAAWNIAERHHEHKPVMEQPQYNLLHRDKVEKEFARLYEDIGLGLTTWSPPASGVLTGKYIDGIPEKSRGALEGYDFVKDSIADEQITGKVRQLVDLAKQVDVTPAQLALAWTASKPQVSTVILGASTVEQVHENLKALDALEVLTPAVKEKLEGIFA